MSMTIFIALVVWVVSWFRAPAAVATSGALPWPGGMGTLDSVVARYPPQQANGASVKLAALANALPKNDAIDEFVRRCCNALQGRTRGASTLGVFGSMLCV